MQLSPPLAFATKHALPVSDPSYAMLADLQFAAGAEILLSTVAVPSWGMPAGSGSAAAAG